MKHFLIPVSVSKAVRRKVEIVIPTLIQPLERSLVEKALEKSCK